MQQKRSLPNYEKIPVMLCQFFKTGKNMKMNPGQKVNLLFHTVIFVSTGKNMKGNPGQKVNPFSIFSSPSLARSFSRARKGESAAFQESTFFNGQKTSRNQSECSLVRAPPSVTVLSLLFAERGVPNLYLFHAKVTRGKPGAPPQTGGA